MNELIKQLAEQAKKYALDAMIKITDKEQALKVYSESYDTKFAELIIEECKLAFWSESCRVSDLAYLEYSSNCKKIQEHFKASNATT
jgi:hypothetical protein